MITGLREVFHGHLSYPFLYGTLPKNAVNGLTKGTIIGEAMGDSSIWGTGAPDDPSGFTSDRMEMNGLYVTNTTNEAYTLTMSFQYGTSLSSVSVIPPLSTTYIITADNPLPWYGGGWFATLYGRTGVSINAGEVAVHINYTATPTG